MKAENPPVAHDRRDSKAIRTIAAILFVASAILSFYCLVKVSSDPTDGNQLSEMIWSQVSSSPLFSGIRYGYILLSAVFGTALALIIRNKRSVRPALLIAIAGAAVSSMLFINAFNGKDKLTAKILHEISPTAQISWLPLAGAAILIGLILLAITFSKRRNR